MRVTVFGGSKPVPGEPAFVQAYELGKLLGTRGYTVLTGGYMGTMEAVSRGANEVGGHVIGVCCDEIENWRPAKPNDWVLEEMRFPTLRERLYALIDECDAAIALAGGIGTLAEIAVMWSQIQVGAISMRPLILVGPGWKATFSQFDKNFNSYVSRADMEKLIFAADIEEAVETLGNLASDGKGV